MTKTALSEDIATKQILESGYKMLNIPEQLTELMKNYILDFIGIDSRDPTVITNRVLTHSDGHFVKALAKHFRFFPDEVKASAVDWVKSLSTLLGNPSQIGVNYVSPLERSLNSELREDSYDIFWRCVRPHKPDTGFAHQDSQFWQLSDGNEKDPGTPFDFNERWKVWIPLFGCNPANSLEIIPGSHRMDVPGGFKETVNGLRPYVEESWLDQHHFICPFEEPLSGKCILFHDDLVHRGPPNLSSYVRISAELTIILRRD